MRFIRDIILFVLIYLLLTWLIGMTRLHMSHIYTVVITVVIVSILESNVKFLRNIF